MSFAIHKKKAGNDAIGAIEVAVNEQLKQLAEHPAEQDMLRKTADAVVEAIGDVNEDHLVDVNVSGHHTTNVRSLSIAVTVTQIRNVQEPDEKKNVAPWAPKGHKSVFAASRSERDGTKQPAVAPTSNSA
jgi:hypothetical protein